MLITNQLGQVLVQHVDYRDTCLLAGGAVDEGESPAHAAARGLVEELGVTAAVDRCLAVDWVSADSFGAPAAMRFPGEILHVFDGGTWDDDRIGDIRLPPSEASSTTVSTKRLASGGLRRMVVEHLQTHPDETFTATGISRAIDRSSGAIANALVTLTKQGIAEQVDERPRTYRLKDSDEKQ